MSPPRRSRRSGSSGPLFPTLDLHGMTGDEAVVRARSWLRSMFDQREPTVRIVTGRGLHSQGAPVLPTVIADLLADLQQEIVEGFDSESLGGAVRVRLRQPPSAPFARTRRSYPDDVVREAGEALAELGIKPTPELIDAEAERILAQRNARGTGKS